MLVAQSDQYRTQAEIKALDKAVAEVRFSFSCDQSERARLSAEYFHPFQIILLRLGIRNASRLNLVRTRSYGNGGAKVAKRSR